MKKQGIEAPKTIDTVELLCKTLRFRSKTPKVVDLTGEGDEEGGNNKRMPDTLTERAIRCKK